MADRRPFLGALLGALTTDAGTPTKLQLDVVHAMLRSFMGLAADGIDYDDVVRLDPIEAAEQLPDPRVRNELAHVLVTCELLLHPLPDELRRQIERYAVALDIHLDALVVARDLAQHHLAMAYADIERMSWYRHETIRESLDGRLIDLARNKLAYYGVGRDPAIAERWLALADLPDGTWGRGVADFYEAHGFAYPGTKHGIYEIGAHHDFVHVLADYAPDPEGEIDVFAFIAGTMEDPRGYMQFVFTLALFQNAAVTRVGGKRVLIARADTLDEPGAVDRLADATRRAFLCPVDIMAGVDHFAWAAVPLDEARVALSLVPKGVPSPTYLDN